MKSDNHEIPIVHTSRTVYLDSAGNSSTAPVIHCLSMVVLGYSRDLTFGVYLYSKNPSLNSLSFDLNEGESKRMEEN